MAEVIGQVEVEVHTNARAAASEAQSAGTDAGSRFGSGFGGSLKKAMAGVGGIIAGAFAAQKVGQFFTGAISGASDLNETISKTQVVFGKGADEVLKFSEGAADSLGQSQTAALDAASTFGTMGKAAGLTGGDLAKFSTDFTGLASDLASFNNTSPEEAVQAIGAALRGEAEPIRKYGVLLDDASLRQEALRQGLIKTTKDALTPQQKTMAAAGLIMQKTSDAQGDFARTSDGLANKQRIVSANFQELQTSIGQLLLPAVLVITNAFLGFIEIVSGLGPVLQGVWDVLTNPILLTVAGVIMTLLIPAFVAMAVQATISAATTVASWAATAAGALASFLLQVAYLTGLGIYYIIQGAKAVAAGIMTVGAWIGMAVAAMANAVIIAAAWVIAGGPVVWFIGLLVLVGAAFVVLWNKSETFRNIVLGVWDAVKAGAQAVWTAIQAAFTSIMGAVKTLGDWISKIPGWFADMVSQASSKVSSMVTSIVNFFGNLVSTVTSKVTGFIGDIVGFFGDLPGKILSALGDIGAQVSQRFSGIVDSIRDIPGQIVGVFSGLAGRILSAIGSINIGSLIKIPSPGAGVPFVPGIQTGGLVSRPTLALVGEAGPELVVPTRRGASWPTGMEQALNDLLASRGGGRTGSGATINVNMPTGDPQAAALAVMDRLAATGGW